MRIRQLFLINTLCLSLVLLETFLILSLVFEASAVQTSDSLALLDTVLMHHNYSSCTEKPELEQYRTYRTCSINSQQELRAFTGCSKEPHPCADGSVNFTCLLWRLTATLNPYYTCRCQEKVKPQLSSAGYSWISWSLVTDPAAALYRNVTDSGGKFWLGNTGE